MIFVVYNSKLEQSFILDKYSDFDLKNSNFCTLKINNNKKIKNIKNIYKLAIYELKSDDELNEPRRASFISPPATSSYTESGLDDLATKSCSEITAEVKSRSIITLATTSSTSKRNSKELVKQEISIDESPLEEVKFRFDEELEKKKEQQRNQHAFCL